MPLASLFTHISVFDVFADRLCITNVTGTSIQGRKVRLRQHLQTALCVLAEMCDSGLGKY